MERNYQLAVCAALVIILMIGFTKAGSVCSGAMGAAVVGLLIAGYGEWIAEPSAKPFTGMP